MSAPERDDLERRLAELLERRAATVTRARPVRFSSETSPATGPKPARLSKHRQNLGVLAAAAAVFVAVAGTVLGIQAGRHEPEAAPPVSSGSPVLTAPPVRSSSPVPTPPSKVCLVAAPASWLQAFTKNGFPVDRSLNRVVSANGATGDYLAVQGNQPPAQSSAIYSDVELALFHGRQGQAIYTPGASSNDIPNADPSGAITAGWVAFAVAHPQGLDGSYKVMLYDRSTGRTTTLAEVSDKEYLQGRAFIGSPVIADGKVYWLTTSFSKPGTTTLSSWDLTRRTIGASIPAPNVTRLIYYGSGVAFGRTVGSGMSVSNGIGEPLGHAVLAALSGGTNLGFDGKKTLSWWRHEGQLIGFTSVELDSGDVKKRELVRARAGVDAAVGPLVGAEVDEAVNSLLDLRSGAFVIPPPGIALQAVVGDAVIFGAGTDKVGAAALAVIPLSALPPAHC
jgi:hypothetical protein